VMAWDPGQSCGRPCTCPSRLVAEGVVRERGRREERERESGGVRERESVCVVERDGEWRGRRHARLDFS
jgi:hypothetical protein